MYLKQLKAFATLAEFGSFSRAGAVLSVGPAALQLRANTVRTTPLAKA